jgi:hypothetical protein
MELYESNLELMEMFLIISYYYKQSKLVFVLYANHFLTYFFTDGETNKIKLFYIILLFILLNTNLLIKYLHLICKKLALI